MAMSIMILMRLPLNNMEIEELSLLYRNMCVQGSRHKLFSSTFFGHFRHIVMYRLSCARQKSCNGSYHVPADSCQL
jgi:hypothetical protein